MMRSSDLDEAHKIHKQIKALTYSIQNDVICQSDSFKLYYKHRTFNSKAVMEIFGADEQTIKTLGLRMDNVFTELLQYLLDGKIRDLRKLGIKYIPVETKTQEIIPGVTVETVEEISS